MTAVNQLPGTVRVLVVRGEGPAFSAGLDRRLLPPGGIPGAAGLAELAAMPHQQALAEIESFQAAFGAFARPDLISLALVQGHAVGAGFQLALACDVRIAAADAQFTMAEISLGLVPDLGGTKRLVELVGYSRAAMICLTGARVGAADAERMGLVGAVVPNEELASAGEQFVQRILAHPGGDHRDQGAAAGRGRSRPGRAGAGRAGGAVPAAAAAGRPCRRRRIAGADE